MITYGSTFTGIRGLDLAFESFMRARCLYSVERSAFCREVIWQHAGREHRIVADVRDVVAGTVPRTDAIIGGFPCQDVSSAGKRAGLEHGSRSGLWSELARIIELQRPDIVFLENVRGLLSRGFDHVLADLAVLGFDAQWTCMRASDVGAPHGRQRVFVLAYTNGRGLRILAERIEQLAAERRHAEPLDAGAAGGLADADRDGRQRCGRGREDDASGEAMADAAGPQRLERRGPAQGRREVIRGVGSRDRGEAVEHPAGERHAREDAGGHGWSSERMAEPRDPGDQAMGDADDDGCGIIGARDDDDRRDAHGRVAHRSDAALGGHRWPPRPDDTQGWAGWAGARPALRRSPHGLPGWVHNARLADGLRRARLRSSWQRGRRPAGRGVARASRMASCFRLIR